MLLFSLADAETCLTMDIAQRDRNGGHFGVTFFDVEGAQLTPFLDQSGVQSRHFYTKK